MVRGKPQFVHLGLGLLQLIHPARVALPSDEALPHCHHPLIEIDHYGERLIGCVECNVWGRPGDATLPMQLLEDDLEAIRSTRRH
jgi:hypothetical protein